MYFTYLNVFFSIKNTGGQTEIVQGPLLALRPYVAQLSKGWSSCWVITSIYCWVVFLTETKGKSAQTDLFSGRLMIPDVHCELGQLLSLISSFHFTPRALWLMSWLIPANDQKLSIHPKGQIITIWQKNSPDYTYKTCIHLLDLLFCAGSEGAGVCLQQSLWKTPGQVTSITWLFKYSDVLLSQSN